MFYNGYYIYYRKDGKVFLQKETININGSRSFISIEAIEQDITDGSINFMCEHDLSR